MSIKSVCMILKAFFQSLCKLFQYLLACKHTCINRSDLKSVCKRRSQCFNLWFCPKMETRIFFSSYPRVWKPCKGKLNFPMRLGTTCPLYSCGPDTWCIPHIPERTHRCSNAWGERRKKEVHAPFCSSSKSHNSKDHNHYFKWWNFKAEKLILLGFLVFELFLLLRLGDC